jgi:hypothetical protein
MTEDLFTICILTLNDREQFYTRLRRCLDPQVVGKPVRIITIKDNYEQTIGAKRNAAVDLVETEYMAFIDDDDVVSMNYVDSILAMLEARPDAVGIKGQYSEGNYAPVNFINTLGYAWEVKPRRIKGKMTYLRPVNHLNPIKTEIARQYPYPEINHAEDMDYANRMAANNAISVCPLIDSILYFYQYRKNK